MPFNKQTVAPALSPAELQALTLQQESREAVEAKKAEKQKTYNEAWDFCAEGVALALLSRLGQIGHSAPWFGDDGIQENLKALWQHRCRKDGGWKWKKSPFNLKWSPSKTPIPLPSGMKKPMKFNKDTQTLEEIVFTEQGIAGKNFCLFVRDAADFEKMGIWFGLYKVRDSEDYFVVLDFIDGTPCEWGGKRLK